ncbi:hypothetical protein H6G76_14975 [Nostoc sp. FACHB-152]|uniref:hypothetical protein n=1 Tax=unclassified Nostoc TaxID=2593658 RepID=UPI001684D223|nr:MULTISPECIES: hypothetical protein [unclassified Nostoc]MBD2448437.1 hypothetical protein [Nostoc sp. FACHB-152]MBD2472544.1 hypothetical protein [Nostoc sp. FACHB-145]
MNTESFKNSQTTETAMRHESKEELNQKTAAQFGLSIALGVITIILVSATAYFGLIRF